MSFLPQPSDCWNRSCSSTTGSTGTSATVQLYVGQYDDPNGNLTPDNPLIAAEYYKDENLPCIWRWSVTDQMWFPTITP